MKPFENLGSCALFHKEEREEKLQDLFNCETMEARMSSGEDNANANVQGIVALGIGGGGVAELVGEGLDDVLILVALFPDLDIGADGEGMERDGTFLSPLGEGLGKQVQAGFEGEQVDLVNRRLLAVEGV